MNSLTTFALTGTSVLNATMKTAVETGINDLVATVDDVLLITVPAIIGVIALSAGVNFAMSKVRGITSWAS